MNPFARLFALSRASALLAICAVPVALGSLAACGSEHGPGVVEVMSGDCSTCHSFPNIQDPNHVAQGFSALCSNCHYTDFWRPALGENAPHPEQTFSITSGPHQFDCVDCHKPELGSSLMGLNTDCIGCHTGDHELDRMERKHREVEDYPANPDGTSDFCLECHPNGRDDS
ncbi:MAG: hypothetical protein Tsb0020_39010 [Haliangiales bacterium]